MNGDNLARLLARLLSSVSLLAGGLLYMRIQSMRTALLWPLKLIAGGLASLVVVSGLLGVVWGRRSRDAGAILGGLLGAGLAAFYIGRTSGETDGFDRGLGMDWRARISPIQQARMLRQRWSWQLPATHDPRVHGDVVYHTPADSTSLVCDIWQPPWDVRPSGLVCIYIHGGGWCFGKKDYNTRAFFRQLAAQGHVIMDIEYRLAPAAQVSEMLADVKHAVAWIKQHGARYGVNPERVVLAGGSAGAHLALLAAYTPNHPQLDPPDLRGVDTSVRAVVAFYPPADLTSLYHYGQQVYDEHHPARNLFPPALRALGVILPHQEYVAPSCLVDCLLGGPPDEVPDRYALASPLSHVGAHCPPTLLLHGTHDCIVPVSHSRVLRNALLASQVEVVLVEYPQADHGFDLAFPEISPSAQAALYDVERFLALMV